VFGWLGGQHEDILIGKPQGAGLGLHISRHIVERFGGRVWAKSRLDQGACFCFTPPIAALSAPAPVPVVKAE